MHVCQRATIKRGGLEWIFTDQYLHTDKVCFKNKKYTQGVHFGFKNMSPRPLSCAALMSVVVVGVCAMAADGPDLANGEWVHIYVGNCTRRKMQALTGCVCCACGIFLTAKSRLFKISTRCAKIHSSGAIIPLSFVPDGARSVTVITVCASLTSKCGPDIFQVMDFNSTSGRQLFGDTLQLACQARPTIASKEHGESCRLLD